MIRRFHHSEFDLPRLLEHKTEPITVVLPAREVADTIGQIVETLRGLDPLIDQILVVDADSRDGTAEVAAAAGAEVHSEARLVPELGQVLGKGDAMWRAIGAVRGEVVAYLDSDTRDFSPHFALGMLGPLLVDTDVQFVKAFYTRPYLRADGTQAPLDGGRVTELTARPLLSAFFPSSPGSSSRSRVRWRCAGPCSTACPSPPATPSRPACSCTRATRSAGRAAWRRWTSTCGEPPPAAARPGPMAYAVLRVVLERLRAEGRLIDENVPPFQTADGGLVQVELVERPPYATLRAPA